MRLHLRPLPGTAAIAGGFARGPFDRGRGRGSLGGGSRRNGGGALPARGVVQPGAGGGGAGGEGVRRSAGRHAVHHRSATSGRLRPDVAAANASAGGRVERAPPPAPRLRGNRRAAAGFDPGDYADEWGRPPAIANYLFYPQAPSTVTTATLPLITLGGFPPPPPTWGASAVHARVYRLCSADPEEENRARERDAKRTDRRVEDSGQGPASAGGGRYGGRARDRHREATGEDRIRDARPRVHEYRLDQERHHLPRRREGDPALPRDSHRRARREVHVRRDLVPPHLRSPAEQDGARQFLRGAHPPLHAPRGHEAVLRRVSAHRSPDGDPVGHGALALELLSRGARREEHRRARVDHRPAGLEDADHRRLLVQKVDRAAVRLSEEQPVLLRQLPEHDVLGPGRALRDRRGHREGAEPSPHPPRRSRAELQHLDGASGRQLAGEPVRLDLGRHLRALGPSSRRSERRGPHHAGDHSARRRGRRSSSSWPRRRTPAFD